MRLPPRLADAQVRLLRRDGGNPAVVDPEAVEDVPVAADQRAALPGLRSVNSGFVPGLLRTAGPRARRSAAAVARELVPG